MIILNAATRGTCQRRASLRSLPDVGATSDAGYNTKKGMNGRSPSPSRQGGRGRALRRDGLAKGSQPRATSFHERDRQLACVADDSLRDDRTVGGTACWPGPELDVDPSRSASGGLGAPIRSARPPLWSDGARRDGRAPARSVPRGHTSPGRARAQRKTSRSRGSTGAARSFP